MASEVDLSYLTEAERQEIEECKRIIQFAKDVNTGVHPRVTTVPHLRKLFGDPDGNEDLLDPSFTKHTKNAMDVDFSYDYYGVLCLDSTASKEEINERFLAYCAVHHPEYSEVGKSRWLGKQDKYRQMAFRYWNSVKKAHYILSSDDLRPGYDQGRQVSKDTGVPPAKVKAHQIARETAPVSRKKARRSGKDFRAVESKASSFSVKATGVGNVGLGKDEAKQQVGGNTADSGSERMDIS